MRAQLTAVSTDIPKRFSLLSLNRIADHAEIMLRPGNTAVSPPNISMLLNSPSLPVLTHTAPVLQLNGHGFRH